MSMISSTLPGMTIAPNATDREKLAVAAKQFEAVFLRQMLAEVRKTHFADEPLFGSQALDTFHRMLDEHVADLTADSSVLGLAGIIEAQMARLVADASTGSGRAGLVGDVKADTATAPAKPPTSAHAEPVEASARTQPVEPKAK